MTNLQRCSALVLLLGFVLPACSPATPSSTPPPAESASPVPMLETEAIQLPSTEPSSTHTCAPDMILEAVRAKARYEQIAVNYLGLPGTKILSMWFVDPEINPQASQQDLPDNADLAYRHAVAAALELKRLDPCVTTLFDRISMVVVDRNYNGWYSAEFDVASLPVSEEPSDEALLEAVEQGLSLGYERQTLPQRADDLPLPEGTRTWVETRAKIFEHFSHERQNVDFYLVVDETGVNLWAQWDRMTDMLELELAAVLNVSMEARALDPPLDTLWVILVDAEGEIRLIGRIPGEAVRSEDPTEAINQFEILYQ